jgi:hypothetical protein
MSDIQNPKTDKILCHIDMSIGNPDLKSRIKDVWGEYIVYHIFNLPETDYVKTYEELAESLGRIRLCPAVNSNEVELKKSTDIKFNPDLYHYFASDTRQPLHTDYSYYPLNDHPDWLMLYCLGIPEYGGKTNILSVKTLISILEKYNPNLLKKINTNVVWKYKGVDGEKIHKKPLFDGTNINWNYWQIDNKLNNNETMKIREELFNFLENVIVDGNIYDFSKKWSIGDCIIFNDHLVLHGRDAFLGHNRWLKDHAFFEK